MLFQQRFSSKTPKKIEGGHFEDFKKIRKSLTKPKKEQGKSHSAEKLEEGLLGFAFQGRGLWMRSKSSTEYFWY